MKFFYSTICMCIYRPITWSDKYLCLDNEENGIFKIFGQINMNTRFFGNVLFLPIQLI